jgi:hypothetical protein
MKILRSHLVAAGLAAALGASAFAQTQTPAPAVQAQQQQAHRGGAALDPAKRQELRQLRMERRLAALKLKLQISTAQEPAFNAWASAMKPTGQRARFDRAELERLTTPERIDRMRALRTARAAEMDRRGDATKTFYAGLSADQKKVFDGLRFGGKRGGHGGHRGHHDHHRG